MTSENILGLDSRPRFFAVGNAADLGFQAPQPRLDVAVRTYVRSLAGMQKEAIVASSETGAAWRMVSDEGPYLQGHDEAPFPLAFMAAGMVASYFGQVRSVLQAEGHGTEGLRFTLDNRYTMEGSALRGTMTGGALPPELQVELDAPIDPDAMKGLCQQAVDTSPLAGLLGGEHTSRFTITHNGRELGVGKVASLDADPLPDPADRFDRLAVGGPDGASGLMEKTATAERREGEGGVASSLQAEQKRMLHVRAICTARPDGIKEIDVQLFRPTGSSFRFLADEPDGGRAPDAASLISAGLGFCFMTQFGRYATITKKRLDSYRIIQDTHFSDGEAATGRQGRAEPVETHVYLDTPEDEDFARILVDMGEQTCFLHATCRTPLELVLTA